MINISGQHVNGLLYCTLSDHLFKHARSCGRQKRPQFVVTETLLSLWEAYSWPDAAKGLIGHNYCRGIWQHYSNHTTLHICEHKNMYILLRRKMVFLVWRSHYFLVQNIFIVTHIYRNCRIFMPIPIVIIIVDNE